MIEVTPESNPEPHRHRLGGSLWVGIAFVLFGIIMILQTAHLVFLNNWWALFILMPAFWAYMVAWDIYQDNSRLTRRGASSLTVGILLTILTLVFLFNLAAGYFWPVLLILGGLILLGTGFLPE